MTYLAEQAGLQAGDAPAVPWPEQDIYLLCGRSILRGLRLYRYRPANDAWQALMRDEPFMFMAGAPAAGDLVVGDGLLLQAWGSAQARTRLLAFAPGADRPWLDERQTGAGLVAEGEALAGLFAALAGSGPADQAAAAPAAERLAAALGLPAADLAVQAALATLDHPDLIFVGATDRGRGQGLVLATDPAGDRVDVRLRLERPLARFDPLALSPDGRWLTARSAAPPPGAWEIALHAISGERTLRFASNYLYTYPGHDWSEDGRWWLRMENGLIHLVSPDAGVERAIVHPFRMCAFGTWAR